MISEVHFILEKDQSCTGTGFAIGIVAKRIIGTEAFGSFATSNTTSQVIFFINEVIPKRHDSTLVVDVPGFGSHIGHAGIIISCSYSVAHSFILLLYRHVTLIV